MPSIPTLAPYMGTDIGAYLNYTLRPTLNQLLQRGLVAQSPAYVRVTGRKGGLFVQFNAETSATGYEVTVSSDQVANTPFRKEIWDGRTNTEGFVSLGQVSGTYYVKIRSKTGEEFSSDSIISSRINYSGSAAQITAGAESNPVGLGGGVETGGSEEPTGRAERK